MHQALLQVFIWLYVPHRLNGGDDQPDNVRPFTLVKLSSRFSIRRQRVSKLLLTLRLQKQQTKPSLPYQTWLESLLRSKLLFFLSWTQNYIRRFNICSCAQKWVFDYTPKIRFPQKPTERNMFEHDKSRHFEHVSNVNL